DSRDLQARVADEGDADAVRPGRGVEGEGALGVGGGAGHERAGGIVEGDGALREGLARRAVHGTAEEPAAWRLGRRNRGREEKEEHEEGTHGGSEDRGRGHRERRRKPSGVTHMVRDQAGVLQTGPAPWRTAARSLRRPHRITLRNPARPLSGPARGGAGEFSLFIYFPRLYFRPRPNRKPMSP